jgi:hypothetical protein
MIRRETIVAGLICLNLGLVAALAYVWTHRSPPRTANDPPAVASTTATRTLTRIIRTPAESSTAAGATRFTWPMIETSDFKKYIANLRAIECPEQTIQDIIIAEVNKLYAAREAALKLRPEQMKPWETVFTGRNFYQKQKQFNELVREKRALLKELLGIDMPIEMSSLYSNHNPEPYQDAYRKLPEAKRDLVRAIQEDYWDKADALQQRTKGYWEPEDLAEQRKIRAERKEALAKVLTADEWLDFELATSSTANSLRSQLSAFNASEQEFREIFKLHQRFDEESSSADPGGSGTREARARMRNQMEEQVKSMLGEQRYAEYQRSQDWNFRNLSRVAQQNGLQPDTAIKAYDVQRLALDEASRVRSDATLTAEQRNETLKAMQEEVNKTLTGLLGQTGFESLQRNGGVRIYSDRTARAGVTQPVAVPNAIAVPRVIVTP